MSEERKTLHQRIAELLKRHEEAKAELSQLKARAKEADRKFDVRRKIVMGAAVQAHAKVNSAFREELRKAILAGVTRQRDREILPEFFPEAAPPPAPLPSPPPPHSPASPARPTKLPGDHPTGPAPA